MRQYAVLVLSSLSKILQGRDAMKMVACVPTIVGLLTDAVPGVREAAACALDNLALSRDGALQIINEENTVHLLVAALFDNVSSDRSSPPSASVTCQVVSVLGNVTCLCDGAKQALQAQVVPKLIQILEDEASSSTLLVKTLYTMWNVSNQEDGKAAAISNHAVETIAVALQRLQDGRIRCVDADEIFDFKRCGTGALMAIAVDENGKPRVIDHCVEIVCSLLSDNDPEIAANAKTIANLAAESPGGYDAFTYRILHNKKLLLHVYGDKSAQSLNQLLKTGSVFSHHIKVASGDSVTVDATCSGHAVAALETIVRTKKGQDSALACLYIVENLARILQHQSAAARESARECLLSLSQNHVAVGRRLAKLSRSEHGVASAIQGDKDLQACVDHATSTSN